MMETARIEDASCRGAQDEKRFKADDREEGAMRKTLERSSDYTDLDGHGNSRKARRERRESTLRK